MEKIYTGKLLEEAEEQAYSEFEALGADRDEVQITILEQPVKKLFGSKGEFKISAKWEPLEQLDEDAVPAETVVPAEIEEAPADYGEDEDKAEDAAHLDDEAILGCAKIKRATAYLNNVLSALGVKNFAIEPIKKGDMVVLNITGDDLGVIIGRRGETLDALQYLTILAGNRGEDNYCRISIDCCGYREKRKEALQALAAKTAKKVLKTGRRITLEPMNPYERRIIHSKVAEFEGVSSRSTGEEPFRRVTVSSNESRRGSGRRGGGRPAYTGSYRQSSGFSTSFEREYKRKDAPEIPETDYSDETKEFEKNAGLYGKIEL